MKTRVRDRIFMPIAGLILLAAAAAAAAQIYFGRNVSGTMQWIFAKEDLVWKIGLGVALAVLVALAVYCISFLFRRNRNKGMIRQKRDGGSLTISVKALECLVEKCLETHKEMKWNRIRIASEHDGSVILVEGTMRMGTNVPMATDGLQKQIREYLTDCTGIDVKSVNLQITGMHKEDEVSAYSVPDPVDPMADRAGLAEPAEQEPAEEPAPLHQRIFSHQEQPMDMPEPPAEMASPEPAEAEDTAVEEAPAEAEAPAETEETAELEESAEAEESTEAEAPAEPEAAVETAAEEVKDAPVSEEAAEIPEEAADDETRKAENTEFPFLAVLDEQHENGENRA
ncbi:MAG: alkaline shock response membrane anchor protein AmaP [Clostridia bacterium]|nr:alkaline shock response membrane anchor protein AmaP [Clostridia bacterium]